MTVLIFLTTKFRFLFQVLERQSKQDLLVFKFKLKKLITPVENGSHLCNKKRMEPTLTQLKKENSKQKGSFIKR
jgi:hypothetical protein